jgi:hypothetical protein
LNVQREYRLVAQEAASVTVCPYRASRFLERQTLAAKEQDKDKFQRKKLKEYNRVNVRR